MYVGYLLTYLTSALTNSNASSRKKLQCNVIGIPAMQLPRGTLDDRAGELAMIVVI